MKINLVNNICLHDIWYLILSAESCSRGFMVVSVPNASALRVEGDVKLVFWLRMDTYLGACSPGRGISGGL